MHRLGLQRRPLVGLLSHRTRLAGAWRQSSITASSDGTILNDSTAPPDDESNLDATTRERGTFFVGFVLPARYGKWDIRALLFHRDPENVAARVKDLLSSTSTHGFRVLDVEPTPKDGGLFVHFGFNPEQGISPPKAFDQIEETLKSDLDKKGGIPGWFGHGRTTVHRVKGKPWNEDLNIFPSNILRIEFEGPDVHQEVLYDVLRPYGRITSITKPTPVPVGTLRFVTVTFSRIRSAILARNCLHGVGLADNTLSHAGTTGAPTKTRLSFTYDTPIQAHAVRNWLTSHPRIVLPIVAFLLGSLTYTVFDPIRSFFIKSKIMGWFDCQEWRIVKFMQRNVFGKVTFTTQRDKPASIAATSGEASETNSPVDGSRARSASSIAASTGEWRERQEAVQALFSYLAESPSTVAVVHGPQGSGKSKLLAEVIANTGSLSPYQDGAPRKVIEIDCAKIFSAPSDSATVASLAKQTGYWPVFSFLSSMGNLIDLAAVGLIGQKAGFTTTVDAQMKEILEVVGGTLKRLSADTLKDNQKKQLKRVSSPPDEKPADSPSTPEPKVEPTATDEKKDSSILDAVASSSASIVSSGVSAVSSSVSAVSSSVVGAKDDVQGFLTKAAAGILGEKQQHGPEEDIWTRDRTSASSPHLVDETINALPLVIIRNFEVKSAGKREDLLSVLADWVATLVEHRVAHVVVVSDNRENMRRLAKSLPTRPLLSIPLGDADTASALSFVRGKITAVGTQPSTLTVEDEMWVERLGGRASDLDTLIHKVRNGSSVKDAVQDIIVRGVAELRKTAFGDEVDDAKDLPWKPEQVWSVLKQLSQHDEISYAEVLLEFPFKGDEVALRGMEHAELITITTQDGLPVSIKPGKPVYRYVFQRLVNDRIFHAVQDIAYNNKVIAAEEATIRKCEEELTTLRGIGLDLGSSFLGGSGATGARAGYLLAKMRASQEKVEAKERAVKKLKRILTSPEGKP
ncbi:mitochondrial escape protein 2 [Tulasnella sp. 403]|nr:mitochondrial escape protein 2 [Tulasnella sp. 403]